MVTAASMPRPRCRTERRGPKGATGWGGRGRAGVEGRGRGLRHGDLLYGLPGSGSVPFWANWRPRCARASSTVILPARTFLPSFFRIFLKPLCTSASMNRPSSSGSALKAAAREGVGVLREYVAVVERGRNFVAAARLLHDAALADALGRRHSPAFRLDGGGVLPMGQASGNWRDRCSCIWLRACRARSFSMTA